MYVKHPAKNGELENQQDQNGRLKGPLHVQQDTEIITMNECLKRKNTE